MLQLLDGEKCIELAMASIWDLNLSKSMGMDSHQLIMCINL